MTGAAPHRTRLIGALAGTAALAVLLVAVGLVGTVRAGDGLVRTEALVDGVPLTIVRPAGGGNGRPGAVVVHGFAGSARLMQPFADTLARNGYVVVLPDLAGHGASTTSLSDPIPDLDIAVRSLRSQSDVDPDRVVLIGHSRGAAAVMSYAATHPEIAATVAISGAEPGARPRNLLMLYGQFEFPLLAAAAHGMLQGADPTATVTTGHTYGSFADGTARRADPVPGVEHVSILFAPTAHAATLAWLDAAVRPGVAPGAVHPLDRLWPAGLLLLGLLLGFVPLAAAVVRGTAGRVRRDPPPRLAPTSATPVDPVRLAVTVGAGLAAAAVVGAVAPDPALGLAVGGYTAIVLLAFGLGALVADRAVVAAGRGVVAAGRGVVVVGRGVAAVGGDADRAALGPTVKQVRLPMVIAIVVLAAYVTVMIVVPIQTGLTWVAPSAARLLPIVALYLAAWVLFGTAEWLGAGRWYLHAAVVAAPLGPLLGLAAVGLGPGFLALILPLLAGLLAIGAGVAAVLRRLAVPPWLIAAVAAPPFAWVTATTLPLA